MAWFPVKQEGVAVRDLPSFLPDLRKWGSSGSSGGETLIRALGEPNVDVNIHMRNMIQLACTDVEVRAS